MRRLLPLLPLLLLLLIPAPSTARAAGCPPSTCGTTSIAPLGSRVTLIRRTGPQGPAEGYDLVTGERSFSLPNGVLAADGRTFVSSRHVEAARRARRTMLERYDARTGRLRSTTAIQGTWSVAAVSANTNRVALMNYRRRGVLIAVVDSAIRFRKALPGTWEAEALSPDGTRLFLVHWNRSGGYTLENIDTRSGRLSPTRLVEPGKKMSGLAQGAVVTRDGRRLLTLYVKADGGTFIHALDLRTGLGHCLDLPLRGGPAIVGFTALSLSPDERILYLASPFLGRVTTVDLDAFRVSRSVRFARLPEVQFTSVGPSAAVTRNGRMLAFTGNDRAWLYDTAFGLVRSRLRAVSEIRGIGFSPDGRRLMTLAVAGNRAFDAATGKPVG